LRAALPTGPKGELTLLEAATTITRLSVDEQTLPDGIALARRWLAAAQRVVVLTGAGCSAESGVPTFRGASGLWRQFRPEALATPEAFARDPKLVWEWYDWRRQRIAEAQPNPGHLALVALEQRLGEGFALFTQNVDGLHERAGSQRVWRLHGDIWLLRCTGCGHQEHNPATPLPELPPRCGRCGSLFRPGVVWFGEPLPADVLQAAFAAARRAEVCLVLGTSSMVYPAALIPQHALKAGARVVEINLEPTELSAQVHLSLRGRTGELLPQIVQGAG
jgi:NAD-dependent deacetylase